MSKSLEQIGYSILEQYANHRIVKDESVEIEMVYDQVHDIRNFLMDRELKKFRRLDPMFYTVCNCLEVKCTKVTCLDEDGDIIDSGHVERYSNVPFLQNSLGIHTIKYLGTPDFKNPLRQLNFPFGMGGYNTKHVPAFYLVGGKIIYNNIDDGTGVLTLVSITKHGACKEDYSCDVSAPYNIPDHLVHELEGMALKRLVNGMQIPRDKKNNNNDDV